MSNISHQTHDKLVQKFLEDKGVAIDLFKNHLPVKTLENLDLATLQASSETAVSDKWKKYHNDIVFHCKTKSNEEAYIYLLVEHQSTPDPFMPVRILRYKLNVLAKYLDAKKQPKKLPNVVSLVIYHGEKKYPYAKDVFSCFEDRELAFKDIVEAMNLVDLTDAPDGFFEYYGGADAVLKILLRYGNERDFVDKVANLMEVNPAVFINLSDKQVEVFYEYTMFVGKGNQKSEKKMKESIQSTYGEERAEKFFSLADYYKQEGEEKGKKGRNLEIAKQMITKGMEEKLICDVTGLTLEDLKKLNK